MNRIDFLHPGGFPLDEDALDYMQQAYLEGYKAIFGDAGSTPVILSGMIADYTSGLSLTAGYFYYNGEIYSFPGGAVGVPGAPPTVQVITLTVVSTAVDFEDGTAHDVYFARSSALNLSAPDANNLDFASFKTWHNLFGQRAAAGPYTTMTFGSGSVSGTLSYKKNYLTNMLHLKGSLTITSGSSFPANPALFYNLSNFGASVLPADCRPVTIAQFKCFYRYHSAPILEVNGLDYIRDVNAEVQTSGQIAVGLLRTSVATTYTVSFNALIPLG